MYYSIILIVILVVANDLKRSMKLVKLKDFIVFQPWRREKSGSNGTVNEISEDFSTMGFVV